MPVICLKCITDDSLVKIAKKRAHRRKCTYCGGSRLSLTIEELARVVDGPLRAYCRIGRDELAFREDGDGTYYKQQGESLVWLLQEELGIEVEPAQELAAVLQSTDPADIGDGEEPFYSDESNYQRAEVSSWEFAENWNAFARRIKHERRFFDDRAREMLADIVGEPGSQKAAELPSFEVGPGARMEAVFRARHADSEQEAYLILQNPAAELGPPPPEKAIPGRMNATGISVYYGALSESTAVAEVRPSVGGLVVVGQFKPSRTLRILDLSKIGIGFTGSIFHAEYENRAARLGFLEGFHRLIARPIQPHEEPLEYIPTQAVAEYVSNVLGFDGILYASAQRGAVPEDDTASDLVDMSPLDEEELRRHNIVLFGDSAKVEISEAPLAPGSEGSHSLVFQKDSAHTVKIREVSYHYERVFIHDPCEPRDEDITDFHFFDGVSAAQELSEVNSLNRSTQTTSPTE